MTQKQAEVRVSFDGGQGRRSDIYTVRVGPATCEFRRKEKVLRLGIFGRVQDIPLGGGTTLTYAADWGSLQVTDVHYDGSTEFKLTWDDHFEERGVRASEYVSVGVDVEGVKYWPGEAKTQKQLNQLTLPAVGRNKKVLLCI